MAAPIERLDVPLPVVEARVKLRALQTNPRPDTAPPSSPTTGTRPRSTPSSPPRPTSPEERHERHRQALQVRDRRSRDDRAARRRPVPAPAVQQPEVRALLVRGRHHARPVGLLRRRRVVRVPRNPGHVQDVPPHLRVGWHQRHVLVGEVQVRQRVLLLPRTVRGPRLEGSGRRRAPVSGASRERAEGNLQLGVVQRRLRGGRPVRGPELRAPPDRPPEERRTPPAPFTFRRIHDWDLRDFDWWYLFACHAIKDAIAQYDAARQAVAA